MPEQENIARHDAALRAQLRLFCQLMLGSDAAAEDMIQQIDRRALDYHDEQDNCPTERVRLFRIAAELCGAPEKAAPDTVPPLRDDGVD
ncbi:hypothetical protein [Nocardia jiangxiensis]|uniref:hypothetical protein n=1 Tax=Nocardia jiangxiensis TaxID=282685 RepID=UPI0002F17B18|nr:hypothetical protein [Nocardia jiangxiensis]